MERYNFFCVNCQKSYPVTSENFHKSICKIIKICPYCSNQISIDDYYDHILNHELQNNNENIQNEINDNNNSNNNTNDINKNKDDNNESKKENFFSKFTFFNIFKNEKDQFKNEKEEENKIKNKEEREAYEKKILGLKKSKIPVSEKIKDFINENKNEIFQATIDLIGCAYLIPHCFLNLSFRIADSINNLNEKKNENEDEDDKLSSNEILNYLPITILGKKINNDIEYKCIICYDNFKEGDKVTTLPCVHVFHIDCIKSWILEHKNCPVCKFGITKSALIGEIK